MANRMHVSLNYGTNLPALIRAMEKTTGDVLELGMGVFSTPYLHYQCLLSKRKLVSYDNDPSWIRNYAESDYAHYLYRKGLHEIKLIKNWDEAPIEKEHWGAVLVDHNPVERRKVEIARLANIADYVIIHDTESHMESETGYEAVYPLFKYRYNYRRQKPYTSVLSNFIEFYL